MEDEDGTCLLDVLCDPQALNDFLHGTNELSSGDLLINSSSGEPSLFTDTPSPASLLADDTPGSGCVDLSFLEEALLSSLGRGGLEVQEHPNVQLQICDILQQSLQEAEITEDTLALEAGLGQTAEALQLSLSATSLISLPKDTQTAVDPPQPSLLAVGPGCPSLKPPGSQLMSLLPGNVFPTPPLEATFSINSTQSTSMIIQKTLPTLIGRQMLTPTPSKAPQPIQPKLPVNIQPRLVQISPRPSGIAFISANTSQSVFLSTPSAGSKQAQSAQSVSKPVSFNLVGQGSPIVIHSQDPFQGQRQFFLPSQVPASTQPTRCLFSTPVSNKPNIVTVRPRQINFSPIFTSPTGQLTLKQGALLPIQSTPPTVFQMPTQIAGTYASQDASTVGNQITLINNANVLIPDMTTIPVVNGQSVMQSLPMVPPGQGKVLLLPEKMIEDGEQVKKTLQVSGLVPPDSAEAPAVKIHPQPAPLQSSPEPVLSLSPQLIAQQYTPLARTLLEQMDDQTSTAIGEAEDSLTALTASETLPSLCESEEISMPVYPVAEHSDILPSPIEQLCTALELTSTHLAPDKQDSSISVAPGYQEGSAMSRNPPSSMDQTHGLTEPNGTTELKFNKYDDELTVRYTRNTGGMISSDQQEEMLHLGPRPQTLDQEIYSALQKKLQTSSEFIGLQEEKLTPVQKQQRVRQQLLLDHSAVLNPNTAPFVSEEEAVRRLLPYHTCARALPSQADFVSVDKEFECFSIVLLKRIKDMLNKYRQLLLVESQQESPSAEMVMLERLFLQSERLSLGEDKRRARRDQEFFLTSQPRISTQNSQVSSVKTSLSESPPSPPSWTLQSDRPPGLKTYRSSSKGALRLTIKHECGSGKVIHNSVSDTSNVVGGLKRNYSGQLTKGGAMQGKDQFQSNVEENKSEKYLDMETIRTGNSPQNLSDSVPKPDYVAPKKEGLQCSPVLKRNRLMASTAESLVEDGELTEHLQSAIDSILELQKLQGSGAGLKPKNHHPHALEQAISSMLEGQL